MANCIERRNIAINVGLLTVVVLRTDMDIKTDL
jgi:hypothetical protein